MVLSRRDFLKISGAALSSVYFAPAFGSLQRSRFLSTIPILQTFTNETSAQFRILTKTNQKVVYEVQGDHGKTLNVEQLDRYIHPAWPGYASDHLLTTGLDLGKNYSLIVRDLNRGEIVDQRFFSALDRQKVKGRTALISCLCDDFPEAQAEMWNVVAQQNPDLIFLIGDAVYLDGRDSDDEAGMWRRHLEVRTSLDLFRWKRLKPVLSVWDDHDFGINDGSKDFPFKKATRRMFQAMFGSLPRTGLELGPSLALEASCFGQKFILMDDRYYRTKDVRLGTHWGDEQEEWLFSRLSHTQKPTFLMNGSQFFGAYSGHESFEKQHAENFKSVLKNLSKKDSPIVFVSGDRHFSELMKIEPEILGYETLELTSSSLHSYAPDQLPEAFNPRRFLATKEYNFLVVDSSAQNQTLDLRIRSIGPGSRVLFDDSRTIRRDS